MPLNAVTPSRRHCSQNRLAEKRRLMIDFAPTTIAATIVMYLALAWNSGNTESRTSSSV